MNQKINEKINEKIYERVNSYLREKKIISDKRSKIEN